MARLRRRGHPGARPGPGPDEGPVELGHEVQGVGSACAAEGPAGHRTAELAVPDDHVGSGCRIGAVRYFEQQLSRAVTGVDELGDAGPGGDGQAAADSRGSEGHAVLPGGGVLVTVVEGGRGRLGVGTDRTHRRQDRDVAVTRAAGTAQVAETEPADRRIGVGVPTARRRPTRLGVRAPLDHPERDIGSGELGDGSRIRRTRPGPVDGVDQGGRSCDDGRGGGGVCPRRRGGAGTQSGRQDYRDNRRHGQPPCPHPPGSLHPADGSGGRQIMPSRARSHQGEGREGDQGRDVYGDGGDQPAGHRDEAVRGQRLPRLPPTE